MQTLNIYEMDKETIGEVKAYLGVHNVNIEDIMDECTKSVTVIILNDIQDKYTANEVRRMTSTYPQQITKGEDRYDDYMDD
eukprot:4116720-Amphidinium_carterae.2